MWIKILVDHGADRDGKRPIDVLLHSDTSEIHEEIKEAPTFKEVVKLLEQEEKKGS